MRSLKGTKQLLSFFCTAIFHPKNLFGSVLSHGVTEANIDNEQGWLTKVEEIPEPNNINTEFKKTKVTVVAVEGGLPKEEEKLPELSEKAETGMMKQQSIDKQVVENDGVNRR